jgi:regulatory protein
VKRHSATAAGSGKTPVTAGHDARFLDLAVRYLARSDKSKSEVARYLTRRGASPAVAGEILRRLERLGYLDEAAHAARWAERRRVRRPMGRARMREELLQRGFSARLADDTIQKIYATIDEAELASQALAKHLGGGTPARLGRFLESRGFARATIVRVLHLEVEE